MGRFVRCPAQNSLLGVDTAKAPSQVRLGASYTDQRNLCGHPNGHVCVVVSSSLNPPPRQKEGARSAARMPFGNILITAATSNRPMFRNYWKGGREG
eukprot:3512839-Pyramimonas_sp.AAC.2